MASPVGIGALRVWRRAVGIVVAECRDAMQLSQEDLAAETGLNRKFISSLENGHQAPGFEALIKIAVATQMSTSEMLRRAERLAAGEGILESFAKHAEGKTSMGMTTCPRCEAMYERYACVTEVQEPGTFKCRFCKELLAPRRPPGPFIIYEARRLPAKSRRAK